MMDKTTKLKNPFLPILLLMTGIVGCGEITGLTPGPPPGCVGDECLIDEASSYPKPENLVATVTGTDRLLTWSWTESDPYSKIQEVIIQRKLESAPETAFANIAVVEGNATTYTDEAPAAGYIVYRVYVQYNSNLDAIKSNITDAVTTQTKFTKLASGQNFTCGIVVGGTIKCWGNNEFGQLGNATTVNSSVPVNVQGVTGATDISAGPMHVCAVIGGAVKCWGSNEDDQISSTMPDYYASVPVAIPNTTGATSISTGNFHGCAVVGGAVKCWGANFYGQLGNGTTTPAVMTTPVTTGATAVAAGSSHTCAIVSGSIKCWGKNNYGQLGLGNYVDNFSPTNVPSTANTSSITAGDTHTCATIVGIVKCWGQDNFGQLGDGSIIAPSHVSLSPTSIPSLTGVESISAGQRNTCSTLTSGAIKCWGYQFSYSPSQTQITASATFVSSGMDHTCAVVDGFAKCWGNNEFGKLGNGTTTNSTSPVDVY